MLKWVVCRIHTALQQYSSIPLHNACSSCRDVKPLNIIASERDGRLKLIDLGAAADLRTGTNYSPEESILDPMFCPPEQVRSVLVCSAACWRMQSLFQCTARQSRWAFSAACCRVLVCILLPMTAFVISVGSTKHRNQPPLLIDVASSYWTTGDLQQFDHVLPRTIHCAWHPLRPLLHCSTCCPQTPHTWPSPPLRSHSAPCFGRSTSQTVLTAGLQASSCCSCACRRCARRAA